MQELINITPFTKIDHIGVVVKDMAKALQYYQSLGIGPFHNLNLTLVDQIINGKPASGIKNLTKVARMGELQFELVQPISGESLQRKFLETRGEGINHFAFYVKDLNSEVARMETLGFKQLSSARFPNGGGAVYFDTDRLGGIIFEIVEWPPGFNSLP